MDTDPAIRHLAEQPVKRGEVVKPTVIRYADQVEGFRGWLVIDGERQPLAAGGMRVRRGLREAELVSLARQMSLKERLLGLGVDGAKAGIDYDPRCAGKEAALGRFFEFIRPHLEHRLSLGPDSGTTWPEVERAARAAGLPSVKYAVARAQGLDDEEFALRLAQLDLLVGGLTLGERRAGHVLAQSALVASRSAGFSARSSRVGIQGFGTLGRGVALSLVEAGVSVVAVADDQGCLVQKDGLALAGLLSRPQGEPLTARDRSERLLHRESIFRLPVDLLVMAACENAMSLREAKSVSAHVVAVGANHGICGDVENLLWRRGVVVVPDFVGGCGGSASMDALFGRPRCPTPVEVLERTGSLIASVTSEMLERAARDRRSPRDAALTMCQPRHRPRASRPYGHKDGQAIVTAIAPAGSRGIETRGSNR